MRLVPLIRSASRALVALYIGSLAAMLVGVALYLLASGLGLLSSAWLVWILASVSVGVSLVATGGALMHLDKRARSRQTEQTNGMQSGSIRGRVRTTSGS